MNASAVTLRLALLVGAGGAIGTVLRWVLSMLISQWLPALRFPLGIFSVNVIGCFVIGLLTGAIERHGMFGMETRLFLLTGILGGFTTFSTFSLDTLQMLRRGEWLLASGYVAASVFIGLAAAWLGLRLMLGR